MEARLLQDPPVSDTETKDARIRRLLIEQDAAALVIGRRDDFAWATSGGDGSLLWTDSRAAGLLVITRERKFLVSYSTDNARLAEEQCPGQGYEPVSVRWFEEPPEAMALRCAGEGRILADISLAGTIPAEALVRSLHYPLTAFEQRRLRWVCERVNNIVCDVAEELEPGQTERRVQTTLAARFLADGFTIDGLMVGFDDRVTRYRHPLAGEHKLERYALIHPAVSRWGLHGVCTRLVHFGPPPEALARRFAAASEIEAWTVGQSRPGTAFETIFDGQVRLYEELGFADEWRNHFQGGLTGYVVNEPAHATRPKDTVVEGCPFNWYVTITGTKKEETTLATPEGGALLTLSDRWPVERFGRAGEQQELAALLVR